MPCNLSRNLQLGNTLGSSFDDGDGVVKSESGHDLDMIRTFRRALEAGKTAGVCILG
jgi:hypothetical protein